MNDNNNTITTSCFYRVEILLVVIVSQIVAKALHNKGTKIRLDLQIWMNVDTL